jgi:hypothetical protein
VPLTNGEGLGQNDTVFNLNARSVRGEEEIGDVPT